MKKRETSWKWALVALGCVAFGSLGCLFIDDGDDRANRPGYTECGDFFAEGDENYCSPGQYCADPTFSKCVNGCLSNENCDEEQRCVKTNGEDVGTCQNAKRPLTGGR